VEIVLRNIPDEERNAGPSRDHRMLELVQGPDAADAPDQIFLSGLHEQTARGVHIGFGNGLQNPVYAQVILL